MFVLNISFDVQAYVQRLLAQFGIYNVPIQNEPQEDVSAQNDAIFEDLNFRLLQMRGNNQARTDQADYSRDYQNQTRSNLLEEVDGILEKYMSPEAKIPELENDISNRLDKFRSSYLQYKKATDDLTRIGMSYQKQRNDEIKSIENAIAEIDMRRKSNEPYLANLKDEDPMLDSKIETAKARFEEIKSTIKSEDYESGKRYDSPSIFNKDGKTVMLFRNNEEAQEYIWLRQEIPLLESKKRGMDDLEKMLARDEENKRNMIKTLEELKTQEPTEQEIKDVEEIKHQAEIIETKKDEIYRLFLDLVELRKQMDRALGIRSADYTAYLSTSDVTMEGLGILVSRLFPDLRGILGRPGSLSEAIRVMAGKLKETGYWSDPEEKNYPSGSLSRVVDFNA